MHCVSFVGERTLRLHRTALPGPAAICALSAATGKGNLVRVTTAFPYPRMILRALRLLLLATVAFVCLAPVVAQDETPEPGAGAPVGIGITYGASLNGSLDDRMPHQVYWFEGLRGDLVTVDLNVTRGNLLPGLLLADSQGQALALRDGDENPEITGLRLPETGAYSLVVSRFGGDLGTTRGDFTLSLDRPGASASSGGALRYGDSIISQVTDSEPLNYYLFRGERGDIVSVAMQRIAGDLDPSVQVVDSSGRVIAENDEVAGSGSLDARVDALILQEDGMYVVIASRFGGQAGRSSGSFVLTLDRGSASGLGGSALMAIPLVDDTPADGELTLERYADFYQFTGRKDEVITLRLERGAGSGLDPLVVLSDSLLEELAADDDGAGLQNSLISQYVLPEDGTYYVTVTRYQRDAGTTAGSYQLTLTREGDAFAGALPAVPRLGYGNATIGRITDEAPEALFAFIGSAGDTITASMLRSDGNLDPLLTLLDQDQNELAQDDDSAGSQNARIDRFTLPYTGIYYLRASRYQNPAGGTPTSGSFLITLAQRFDTP